jgi:virulence factor Mce-like protein
MEDAERELRAADERGDATAAFELGALLARRGDLEGAEQAYGRADERGHAGAAAAVGLFQERRGNRAGAEAAYRRADERGDAHGAFRLGLMLSSGGDWAGAKDVWQRAEQRGSATTPFTIEEILDQRAQAAEHAHNLAVAAAEAKAAHLRNPLADPVLIGAVTVLAVLIGVFLAWTATTGLPFVPSRQLKVELADGAQLRAGNDVREGGYYIGLISNIKPVRFANGELGAQLTLKLSQRYGNIPLDSRATVYSKSLLGLKYLDLIKGASHRYFKDGGTMPVSQTVLPVQTDQVFDMFNRPTRRAVEQDLKAFGDTFASRGSALNDTIASLPALLYHLRPVAQYLSAPATELSRFLTTLDTLLRVLAPVAQTNAQLFTDMATTFEAVSRDPQALEATIAKSPSTLTVATRSLTVQQPFLSDFAQLGRSLAPASAELGTALPVINPAIEAGTQTLKRTPPLNARLERVMVALRTLAQAPGTNVAVNALVATVDTLNPMVRYLGPYQTVCDYWNYWWTYLSEHISEATSFGFAQRVLLMLANPAQPNNVGQQGATRPADGGGTTSPLTGGNEFLHNGNYLAAIDNQGNADCENGQRGYPLRLNAFDPQHRNLAIDPRTPGDQGPTFAGRAHVPAGETYTRNPQTGPQLAPNPSNP